MANEDSIKNEELSEEELEAMFAAEVEKEKEKQQAVAEEEPSEEELEAMFAAEVAKEQQGAAASVPKAPPPPPPTRARAATQVKPVRLPSFDNLPGQSGSEPAKDINLDMILDIPVDVHVEVGHTRVKVQEILRLDVGSVVELNRVAGHPADIIVNGKLIGQGDVVVVNENFGIRVTKLVGLEERLNSV
ncbi:MAG: flagellar motor switch protein FliN [Kiritimatiellae bacterium]|nr:flagellar motor switch protein FliN [Kiritimatiellia bacterium]MDD4734792.1 flagellar motor switch protein FliN [Kiritimatiellia bacterium]